MNVVNIIKRNRKKFLLIPFIACSFIVYYYTSSKLLKFCDINITNYKKSLFLAGYGVTMLLLFDRN
jgi:hypothetical protein